MNGSLDGKSIVIIGGTSGLGLAAARACVGAGARVVIVGRDREKGLRALGQLDHGAQLYIGDATDPQTSQNAINLAESVFGQFDGLYHVAGGSGRKFGDGPLHLLTDDGWNHTLQLNLTSLFYSNRSATQRFLDRKRSGSIVNCGSVLGFSPSPHFFSTHAYAAAKAAMIGLTRSAAAQYATCGIRFNIVAPGLVATPMSERAQKDDAIQAFIRTKQPLQGGRIGVPTDLDGAVLWLLSDSSAFVTGQMIAIDGGWSITEGQYSA